MVQYESAPCAQAVKQYLNLCQHIIDNGVWVHNPRTHKRCQTVIGTYFSYDVGANQLPLVTTRKCYWRAAIAELIGYLRGYDNAQQFADLGANTWWHNANHPTWQQSPFCKGEGDMGRVYGVQGRQWQSPEGKHIDQLAKVVANLSAGVDDRAEIVTFYNVGELDRGCLRPCMHTHQFSLLGDDLYLTSYQRSCDVPLGLTFNQVQVFVLLKLIAQITQHQPKIAYHHIANAHIYEDQMDGVKRQLTRTPYPPPRLHINPNIKTLADIENWVTLADFQVEGYQHHPPIAYSFSA